MAIHERQIIEAVTGLNIAGNEEGLIPAFGLYLTRHFADYYNRVSFATARRMERTPELVNDSHTLLVEAGHVCAFNTFGGIMMSAEWDAVVAPMVESAEDRVRGLVAVVNTFGWGRWSIAELVSGAKLTMTIDDSYEAAGWRRDYPTSALPRCYLATGGVAGMMNLVYHTDLTKHTRLTEELYLQLFRAGDAFVAKETSCAAMGAPRCVITATRA